jgi:Flp pilus assembly protein TadG
LFILALIDLSRAYMATQQLMSAARDGCRTGVVSGTSTTTIKSVVTSALSAQGITGVTATVKVNGSSSTDASAAVSNDVISVAVTVPYSNVTWLPSYFLMRGDVLSGDFSLQRE